MPSHHDVFMCHILIITCHRKFNPVRSSVSILSIPLSISMDFWRKYLVIPLIIKHPYKTESEHLCMLPWLPFLSNSSFQNILILLVVNI